MHRSLTCVHQAHPPPAQYLGTWGAVGDRLRADAYPGGLSTIHLRCTQSPNLPAPLAPGQRTPAMSACCPSCRSPSGPVRRCFVEAECPVCLTTTSSMHVLTCGHLVCSDDLAALGLVVEKPSRACTAMKSLLAAARQAMAYLPVPILILMSFDPGAPIQKMYSFAVAVDDVREKNSRPV